MDIYGNSLWRDMPNVCLSTLAEGFNRTGLSRKSNTATKLLN